LRKNSRGLTHKEVIHTVCIH